METFSDYVASIENEVHRKKFAEIGEWMNENYPKLQLKFGWSQPMFTDHGTFIIGFKKKKNYITVSPEVAGMKKFKEDIDAAGYQHTDNTFQIKWKETTDYDLLKAIIDFNIQDKSDFDGFWRKPPNKNDTSE